MRKHWRMAAALFAAVAVLALVVGCSSGNGTEEPAGQKGPINIGSKIDTEGELLGSMIELKLKDAGYTVVDKTQTGATDVVRKALLSGDIDIYPEYTGSGLLFFEGNPEATVETFKNPEKGYETSKKLDEPNGVIWLTPAKANNTWAIVVKKDMAASTGVETMSDMADYVKGGKATKVAASDEFFNNVDAWPAFASTYGFDLTKDQKVIFSGGNTAQTEQAVANGTDGVNFGMAYGTDGALADLGLQVLTDDKEAQLVYWPVPIIRKAVLDKFPEIETLLAPVFESLTLEKLQELNARIQVQGEDPKTVADEYLKQGGFVK